MNKTFCDSCGKEMSESSLNSIPNSFALKNSNFKVDVRVYYTDGKKDLCLDCFLNTLRDAVNYFETHKSVE